MPSAARLLGLLEAMDRELRLGLDEGGAFRAFVRLRSSEEPAEETPPDPILDTTSFEDFRLQSGELSGEPKEIQVQLGRPGVEPLRDGQGLETKGVEVLGHPSLRMIDVGGLEETSLLCPSCGERSVFDAAFSVQPDPRFYCGRCGGLTPLPETRFAWKEQMEGIPFPCYRFATVFHVEAEADGVEPVSAPAPDVVGIQSMEGALGCGLRAVLVGSPRPAQA